MIHQPENEACMCVCCMGPDKDPDDPNIPWAYIASLNAFVVAVFAMVHL